MRRATIGEFHLESQRPTSQKPSTPSIGKSAPKSQGVGAQIFAGAAWMLLLRLALRVIGFASTALLARLLVPADYGIVAIASSLLGALEALGSFGIILALIRYQDADRSHYDTVWTINLAKSLITAGLIVAGSYFAAGYFAEPRLESVLYVMALAVAIQGAENVGVVDFRKHLRFDKEFQLLLVVRLVSFVVTVGAALLIWRNHWALIAGLVAQSLTRFVMTYAMHPFRPRLSLAAWRKLFAFSAWSWVTNLATLARSQGRTMIVASYLDSRRVGLFSVGQDIANLPMTELVHSVTRVLFSGFARVNEDPDAFGRMVARSLAVILLIHLPTCLGLMLLTEPFVRVVLGTQWLELAPLIVILAGATLLAAPGQVTGIALVALGRPQVDTACCLAYAAIELPLLFYGLAQGGLHGGAWAILAVSAIDAIVSLTISCRILRLSVASLARDSYRAMVASAAMTGAVYVLGTLWGETPTVVEALAKLLAMSAIGAAIYASLVLALWIARGRPASPESQILGLAYKRFAWMARIGPRLEEQAPAPGGAGR